MDVPASVTPLMIVSSVRFDVTEVAISDDVTTGETNNATTTILSDAVEQLAQTGFIDGANRAAVIEAVHCYLLPVVFLLGVSGNVMSVVVLCVHGLSSSTNVLLLGVTVSDLCFLVSMYARKVSCIVAHVDVTAGRSLETALIPNVYMVNRIFSYTTPFLTMLITLERCLAVTLPLKVQSMVTSLRMKVAVTSVFLLSIVAQFPFFFIYRIEWSTDKTGRSIPNLRGTSFFHANFEVITAYNNLVLSAIFNYVPMVVVIICTVIVITTVRKSSRWRKITSKSGSEGARDERRMTRLLMTVVGVYIVCYFPRCVVLIANSLAPHSFNSLGGRYGNLFYVISALQLLLFAVNSSINFVIYMVMSRKFLHTYLRIFLCRKQPGGRERNQTGMSKGVTSLTNAMSADVTN
ncbi:hypothetical protein ACOMHN_037844 [Nucella lapillus]